MTSDTRQFEFDPNQPTLIRINGIDLVLPEGTVLPQIMLEHPDYDFGPWGYIGEYLLANSLQHAPLLDIGANIGSSCAHFRHFSEAPIVAVEASEEFYRCLTINACALGAIDTLRALAVPRLMSGVRYLAGSSTGGISKDFGEPVALEDQVAIDDLLARYRSPWIVKSDTDGFDDEIVAAVLDEVEGGKADVPIIFFEGPAREQHLTESYDGFVQCLRRLGQDGYAVTAFANTGQLVAEFPPGSVASQLLLDGLTRRYHMGIPSVHYFDFVAWRRWAP